MSTFDLAAFDVGFSLTRLCVALKSDDYVELGQEFADDASEKLAVVGTEFALQYPATKSGREMYLVEHFGTPEATMYAWVDSIEGQGGKRARLAFEIGLLLQSVGLPPSGYEANVVRAHLDWMNISSDVKLLFDGLTDSTFMEFVGRLRARLERSKRIFISYRRSDAAAYARMLWLFLSQLGHDVFLDVETLKAARFGPEIADEISRCTIFLPILSRHYFSRVGDEEDWVRKELSLAVDQGKLMIPIQLEEFVPSTTAHEYERRVMSYNVCHFYDVDFNGFASKLELRINAV